MATAIVPKSAARKNDNISVGYGEVPAMECEETGKIGWGLPGGSVTFCRDTAKSWAKKLDKEIRKHMKHPRELLSKLPYIV